MGFYDYVNRVNLDFISKFYTTDSKITSENFIDAVRLNPFLNFNEIAVIVEIIKLSELGMFNKLNLSESDKEIIQTFDDLIESVINKLKFKIKNCTVLKSTKETDINYFYKEYGCDISLFPYVNYKSYEKINNQREYDKRLKNIMDKYDLIILDL